MKVPRRLAALLLLVLPKSHADGISLVPALGGETPKRPKPLIWHSPRPRPGQTGDVAASAIRIGDRKLLKKYFPLSFELYDLAADPHEQRNLAADRPEEVAKLRHRLEAFLTRHKAMPPRKDWKDKTVTAPLTTGP